MDPVDREVAWMAVGQNIVDANNIQRVLFHYNQTGQQGKLADFMSEQQLLLPHDAVQLTEAAVDNAQKRRQRLEAAILEYQKIGQEIEQQMPAQTAEQDELEPIGTVPPPTAAQKAGNHKLGMMETKRLENREFPKKLISDKKKSGARKPPSEIIIENDTVKNVATPADDTVHLMPDQQPIPPIVESDMNAPVSEGAPVEEEIPAHKLHYLVAGFTVGVLLCSGIFFLKNTLLTLFHGGQ